MMYLTKEYLKRNRQYRKILWEKSVKAFLGEIASIIRCDVTGDLNYLSDSLFYWFFEEKILWCKNVKTGLEEAF